MKIKVLTTALLVASLLTACNGDNEQPSNNDEQVALQVTSGIQTRAVDSTWESGDNIGLFMLNGTQIDTYSNTQYITTSSGTSASFMPASTVIYLPTDGSTRDFIAYYPFQTTMSGSTYKIDLSDQSSQSAIDFMLADKVTGKSRTDYDAAFVFNHKLAKVVVTFEAGNGLTADDLKGITAKLTNQQTTADFNVLTETEVTPVAGTADINFKVADDGLSAEAIVFPNTAFTDMNLVLTTKSMGEYSWALSSSTVSTKYETGKKYKYTITVNRTNLNVSATITDWQQGNGADGETGDAE